MQSPFYHYNSTFDGIELIHKYALKSTKPTPGYVTNFIGLKISTEYLPEHLRNLDGTNEPIPIPANWHADISEWAAVFRSVELAEGPKFVMGEIGCGWGCWMANAGMVAKSRELECKLYGIEGDSKHVSWAKENLLINGFHNDEFEIIRGIAAAKSGNALFPMVDSNTIHYGLEPIFNATDDVVAHATQNNTHEILPMIPLEQIFSGERKIDLLHIDIQGGEVDFITESIQFLSESASYLVIGTHSRVIEGRLIEILSKSGWALEIERPAIFTFNDDNVMITAVDGLQGWRNPRLLPLAEIVKATYRKRNLVITLDNWSKQEITYRWSEGKKCSIQFDLEQDDLSCNQITVSGFSLGEQNMRLYLNGVIILETKCDGTRQSHSIAIPQGVLKWGKNTLSFELPNARLPGNGDQRMLAFALEGIEIN
jgi:hypothetical protein